MVSESLAEADPLSLDPCLAWRVFMLVSLSSGSFYADPSGCAVSLRDGTAILWIRGCVNQTKGLGCLSQFCHSSVLSRIFSLGIFFCS